MSAIVDGIADVGTIDVSMEEVLVLYVRHCTKLLVSAQYARQAGFHRNALAMVVKRCGGSPRAL
jgi:hypothetical protein